MLGLRKSTRAFQEERLSRLRRNRSVRLLSPLRSDIDRVVLAAGRPTRGLVFSKRGRVWTDEDWRNWRARVWHTTRDGIGLDRARPYDGRHSFGSLLLHERRSLAYVAQQLGDTIETVSGTYLHVIEELAGAHKTEAEEVIREARVRVDRQGVPKVCLELRKAAGS